TDFLVCTDHIHTLHTGAGCPSAAQFAAAHAAVPLRGALAAHAAVRLPAADAAHAAEPARLSHRRVPGRVLRHRVVHCDALGIYPLLLGTHLRHDPDRFEAARDVQTEFH